jgi:hypothetical protein
VFELGELCFVDRLLARAVVGARIHHPLVEPQAVELVADVVVMPDGAAVLAAPVAAPRLHRPLRD